MPLIQALCKKIEWSIEGDEVPTKSGAERGSLPSPLVMGAVVFLPIMFMRPRHPCLRHLCNKTFNNSDEPKAMEMHLAETLRGYDSKQGEGRQGPKKAKSLEKSEGNGQLQANFQPLVQDWR